MLGRALASIWLLCLVHLVGACSSARIYTVDLDQEDIYAGMLGDAHVGHETDYGTEPRLVGDYEWELFLGHAVTDVRLRFDRITINAPDSYLSISDADGNELQRFESSQWWDVWTDVFPTNLLRIRFVVDESANLFLNPMGRSNFHIDRLAIWSDLEQWFSNHPTSSVVASGASPNVHFLNRTAGGMATQHNKEVLGFLPGSGENYYVASAGGFFGVNWDFAVVGDGTGAPKAYDSERDRWYRLQTSVVMKGDFTGSGFDDIAVLGYDAGRGEYELYVSANAAGLRFQGFHLAAAPVDRPAGSFVFAGPMNQDAFDDVVIVSPDSVRVLVNSGDPAYPSFSAGSVMSLPWDTSTFPQGTGFRPLVGDWDGDGFLDVAILIDRTNEVAGSANSSTWDAIRFFRNDQGVAFVSDTEWRRVHLANSFSGYVRRFETGDFDGDGRSDLLLIDRQNAGSGPREFALRVALSGPSTPPTGYLTWKSINLHGDAQLEAIAGDFNGDGVDDVAFRRKPNSNSPPSQITVAYSTTSSLAGGRTFGSSADWTPSDGAPVGHLLSGRFGGLGADALLTYGERTPMATLNAHANRMFAASNPLPRFDVARDMLASKPVFRFCDIDADGDDDVVNFTADARGSVKVMRSESGAFVAERQPRLVHFGNDFRPDGEIPFCEDVNADGYGDLILAAASPSFIEDEAFFPFGLFVALNNTSGGFDTPVRWNTGLGFALMAGWTPLLGDFDGNGFVDAAILRADGRLHIQVALNEGNGFGPDTDSLGNHLDWSAHASWPVQSGTDATQVVFYARDMNGDGRDDVVAMTELESASPSTLTELDAHVYHVSADGELGRWSINDFVPESSVVTILAGTTKDNEFALGKFSADQLPDVASYNSPEAWQEAGQRAVYTVFGRDQNRWHLATPGRYGGLEPIGKTKAEAADVDGDDRDELVLVREAHDLEFIAVDIANVDLDLQVQPIAGPVPSRMPYQDWTSESTTEGVSNELVWGVPPETGSFAIRVRNNGDDGGSYKLISNRVSIQTELDVLFVAPRAQVQQLYGAYWQVFRQSGPELYDAMDGNLRLRRVRFWMPMNDSDLPYWQSHPPNSDIDVYIWAEGDDSSSAVYGEYIDLRDQNSRAFVHEYGHFALHLPDEYCTSDPSDSPVDCGLGPSVTSRSLCPNSLMSMPFAREFCTNLYHAPWGLIDGQSAWSSIQNRYFWLGIQAPVGTPNPHRYQEFMFHRFLELD